MILAGTRARGAAFAEPFTVAAGAVMTADINCFEALSAADATTERTWFTAYWRVVCVQVQARGLASNANALVGAS